MPKTTPVLRVKCEGCGERFEAKRRTAKFCGSTCRQRARRGIATSKGDESLVDAVTRELREAGRLESFEGQLAVRLARQASAATTGIERLSRELRTVMAEALRGSEPVPVPEPVVPVVPESDELTRAREARESKAREAARRA